MVEQGTLKTMYLVVRTDEPGNGEWFTSARMASLKAAWLRQAAKATVTVVRATVDEESGPRLRR
mgnify:CR=1 FL=1